MTHTGKGWRGVNPVVAFGWRALAWFIFAVGIWWWAAPWLSLPAAMISAWALEHVMPMWIHSTSYASGVLQVNSYIGIFDPHTQQLGDVVVDAIAARYAYGLPMVIALLAASRTLWSARRGWRCTVAAYLVLLPAQAFSLCAYVLMHIALAVDMQPSSLGVAQWQLEVVVFAYQAGTLLLPTLVPVMVWLWLDRAFFQQVIIRHESPS